MKRIVVNKSFPFLNWQRKQFYYGTPFWRKVILNGGKYFKAIGCLEIDIFTLEDKKKLCDLIFNNFGEGEFSLALVRYSERDKRQYHKLIRRIRINSNGSIDRIGRIHYNINKSFNNFDVSYRDIF